MQTVLKFAKPTVGGSGLCLLAVLLSVSLAHGFEPVRVINGQAPIDAAVSFGVSDGEGRSDDALANNLQPSAPHAAWPIVVVLSSEMPQPSVVALEKPMVAIRAKPEPSADARKDEFVTAVIGNATYAGTGRVKVTRYNRSSIATPGDAYPTVAPARTTTNIDPNFSAITCVAGCGAAAGKLVYYQPRVSAVTGKVAGDPGIQAAALTTTAGPVVDAAIIQCVAGCYSTPKTSAGRAPLAASQQLAMAFQMAAPIAAVRPQPIAANVGRVLPSIATMINAKRPVVRSHTNRQRVARTRQLRSATPWRTLTTRVVVQRYLAPRVAPVDF